MKISRKQLRKIILQEFDSSGWGKNIIIKPPNNSFGGGGGNNCEMRGQKYDKIYGKVLDAFSIAYPYRDGNHRVFLAYLTKSGIQLPFTVNSASKDLIDYVTDYVLDKIAMDVCKSYIPGNQEYLVNLLRSPFSLLEGVEYVDIISGKKVKKNTGTYLPNAFLKDM